MDLQKRKILMNAFFISQFSYCPLVWMFHSRTKNSKINRLHERCLRIIYNDKNSSFTELLEKDKSVSIHTRNLRFLAIEMFKLQRNIAPAIFSEIFQKNTHNRYDLRHRSDFTIPLVNSVHYGEESLSYLGPKLWETLPTEMRETETLHEFKKKVKQWIPQNCPCKICRTYLPNIGFI